MKIKTPIHVEKEVEIGIIKKPIFIVKESLHKIPLAGWYIKRSGSIGIDRKSGLKSLKKILNYINNPIL